MSTDALPELLDVAGIMFEMRVKRATAEAIMRHVPLVLIPGLRKNYCRRSDVERLLAEWTYANDRVPA